MIHKKINILAFGLASCFGLCFLLLWLVILPLITNHKSISKQKIFVPVSSVATWIHPKDKLIIITTGKNNSWLLVVDLTRSISLTSQGGAETIAAVIFPHDITRYNNNSIPINTVGTQLVFNCFKKQVWVVDRFTEQNSILISIKTYPVVHWTSINTSSVITRGVYNFMCVK